MCGEKVLLRLKHSRKLGSPPRVRGKEPICISMFCRFGITPACAGKSPLHAFQPAAWGDHPRVCGEKQNYVIVWSRCLGSPPRVRGKVPGFSSAYSLNGITPACAGKSSGPWKICEKQGDHPRVCGEKRVLLDVVINALGSPPRVRGKALEVSPWLVLPRITPACAGKSCLKGHQESGGWDHPRVCGEKGDFRQLALRRQGSPPRVRGKGL